VNKIYSYNGHCYEACIASIIHKKLEEIPVYREADHWIKIDKWLYENGYALIIVPVSPELDFECDFPHIVALQMLYAPKKEISLHGVVYQGKELVHDPSGILGNSNFRVLKTVEYHIILPRNPVLFCDYFKDFRVSTCDSPGYSMLERV
jgi:hypothetical protein